jgi:hypothetical protein
MHAIDNKSMRKPAGFLAVISFALVISCAGTGYDDAEYNMDAREAVQNLSCPSNTTAVCISKIGKPVKCFCSDRDDLERLLEPTK